MKKSIMNKKHDDHENEIVPQSEEISTWNSINRGNKNMKMKNVFLESYKRDPCMHVSFKITLMILI